LIFKEQSQKKDKFKIANMFRNVRLLQFCI